MRTSWTIFGCAVILAAGGFGAEDLSSSTNAPPAANVGWTVESGIPITGPEMSRDAWMVEQQSVVGQFLKSPNPLAPINPLTPPPPRFTDATLSRDTVTSRVMGLTLVNLEF